MNCHDFKPLLLTALIVGASAIAHESEPVSDSDHVHAGGETAPALSDHHALVHPFVAHMGMPDEPGEVSVRMMAVQERNSGMSTGTYGFHLEAGIIDRLGLHLRNDGVATHDSTEIMLQYAVLRSESGLNGISLIGELEFPTGPDPDTKSKGLFGLSFAYTLLPVLAVDSVVHYNPEDKMVEWEIAFVSRLTKTIFPVLEFRGEASKEMSTTNALAALKFKIPHGYAMGLGYQVPISSDREYDSQLILEAEVNF